MIHTIDTEYLAKGTTGFTGADIENMVNQVCHSNINIYSIKFHCIFRLLFMLLKSSAPSVTMKHLEYARDKVLMGPAKKSKIPDAETNNITAYHEAGHTIVTIFYK